MLDRQDRNSLDELQAAAEDFWTGRLMGNKRSTQRRAMRDSSRAANRLATAIEIAQEAGDTIPGNTAERRIAIMDAAKATSDTRPSLQFGKKKKGNRT